MKKEQVECRIERGKGTGYQRDRGGGRSQRCPHSRLQQADVRASLFKLLAHPDLRKPLREERGSHPSIRLLLVTPLPLPLPPSPLESGQHHGGQHPCLHWYYLNRTRRQIALAFSPLLSSLLLTIPLLSPPLLQEHTSLSPPCSLPYPYPRLPLPTPLFVPVPTFPFLSLPSHSLSTPLHVTPVQSTTLLVSPLSSPTFATHPIPTLLPFHLAVCHGLK